MKQRFIFQFISLLISFTAFSQRGTYTVSLFYNINEVSSQRNFERIDSLFLKLGKTSCSIDIFGYADFLNTENYNKNLSQKRAETVRSYLLKKSSLGQIKIGSCEGLGEKNSSDNQSKEGEPNQRRVDICVTEIIRIKKSTNPSSNIPPKKEIVQEEPDSTSENKEIESLSKGESLVIEGLGFFPGRHTPLKSSIPVIEKLLKTLKEHPELKIEIQGHICCSSPDQEDNYDFDSKNYKLSENRARTIYTYLIKNGIDESRLTYKGYGHRMPKVEETSPEMEQINRRVEIKILEN